jgi:hypothetical protein
MVNNKVFISAIPFLSEDKLKSVIYKPIGNPRLEYNIETRFPIIPVINGYVTAGDHVRVIAILTEGEMSNAKNTKHNFDTFFVPEIKDLTGIKKADFDCIDVIRTPDNEDIDTQLKLFADIAESINPGDDVYACITYGTKPMPIVLTMALNYAYKLKKDVSIGSIVYGRYHHVCDVEGDSLIYDTTSLFYMDSIVSKMAEIKASDPDKALRLVLGFDTAED